MPLADTAIAAYRAICRLENKQRIPEDWRIILDLMKKYSENEALKDRPGVKLTRIMGT
jgi:hypothetical protein